MKNTPIEFDPQVRSFREGDCESIAPRLRSTDVEEIKLSTGLNPLDALKKSVDISSKKWSIISKGRVIAIFGVAVRGSTGVPWLLSSDELFTIRKSFWAGCGQYIKAMSNGCELLSNYVWVENTTSIKWLKRMGFDFSDPVSYGVSGKKFFQFFMRVGK